MTVSPFPLVLLEHTIPLSHDIVSYDMRRHTIFAGCIRRRITGCRPVMLASCEALIVLSFSQSPWVNTTLGKHRAVVLLYALSYYDATVGCMFCSALALHSPFVVTRQKKESHFVETKGLGQERGPENP